MKNTYISPWQAGEVPMSSAPPQEAEADAEEIARDAGDPFDASAVQPSHDSGAPKPNHFYTLALGAPLHAGRWHTAAAEGYITKVKGYLDERKWEKPEFAFYNK